MISTNHIKQWILDVVTLLGEDEKHTIKEGMDIFAALENGEVVCLNGNVQVKIGSMTYNIPYSLWYEINQEMIAQRSASSAGCKIRAIKKLRQWFQDNHGFKVGLKEAKDAVEDAKNFPAT